MEIKKPKHETQKYHEYKRPMPKILNDRLIKLGLNRQQGETAKQQADRCKAWLKETSAMDKVVKKI